MLNLLIGTDWTQNRTEILRRLARDVKQRRGNRILMVPELISHEMEGALCSTAGDTASRYAEVLSFTRLARRAAEQAGSSTIECLDSGGRIVAMAAAAGQLSSKLKAYASVETKPEFLSDLVSAVDEFKRCCISSQDLKSASEQTAGSLAQKLEELSMLMESYDGICSHIKCDPRDQMTWLLEQLEDGDFAAQHVFYIDGFPDFTRQHTAILEHLICCSSSVTISLNCDSIGSHLLAFEKAGETASELYNMAQRLNIPVNVEEIPAREDTLAAMRAALFQGAIRQESIPAERLSVYLADSPWAEVSQAAHRVRTLVSSGCRYRDISVVCANMGQYQCLVKYIFSQMHIPVYQSGTENILQKSMIATVLTALDAVLSGYEQRSVLAYMRSPLSGVDSDTGDLLENYAVIWNVRGMQWLREWENHPDGLRLEMTKDVMDRLNKLNDARKEMIAPLENLRRGFQQSICLAQQVEALYAFLEDVHMERRLEQLADEMDSTGNGRDTQILDQLWEILVSALEQMHDVLGQTHWETDHFVRLLKLLLSQYNVGTIPPVLDVVQFGPISSMRCHSRKHLILIGAQEGNLPAYSGSTGILTDQERVALRQLGVPLTGGALEGVQAEFAEIYGVFCGSVESVEVLYSGKQPSFVCRRLAELAGGEQHASDEVGLADADAARIGAFLAQWHQEKLAQELGTADDYARMLHRAEFQLGAVSRKNIQKLYGNSLMLSASRVDKQAECRLSYFLDYGLRAKERKEATVDPAEFGSYVHSVLEKTARAVRDRGGFPSVSMADTLELAHEYSHQYMQQHFSRVQSERMEYLFRRNLREVDMVVEELWGELQSSGFQPKAFEVSFGTDAEAAMPPIEIPNGAIRAVLRGFVDRVDIWQSPGSLYFRVVDYKTGEKEFDYCDIFNGVGLQMLLYLFALEKRGDALLGSHPVPAGVQYFPARVPYVTLDGAADAEKIEKERRGKWKRKGLLLNDRDVLDAMEPNAERGRLPLKKNKDGTVTGDLASREQMQLMEKHVFCVLGKLVEEIASGNVDPNPYTRGSSHDACRFCPYGSVCHSGNVPGRRNYKKMTAEEFWSHVEEEIHNG